MRYKKNTGPEHVNGLHGKCAWCGKKLAELKRRGMRRCPTRQQRKDAGLSY